MHDWADLAIFLAAARTGSASRAAVDLGVSVSTVTRRLASLETDVGAPLFIRTSTGLQPTKAAHALRPHAEAAERAVHAGRAAIESLDTTPRGTVRLAVPGDMMVLILLPRLGPFLAAHPEVTLAFDTGTVMADLMRREADLAVRVTRPTQGDELVTRRLRDVEWGVFAREEVLADIDDPTDATQHRWIGPLLTDRGLGPAYEVLSGGRYALRLETPLHIRMATAAGLGTALMPRLFGELTPGLVEVPIPGPPPTPLYLVGHKQLRHNPRVAATWAMLVDLLEAGTAEDDRATVRPTVEAAYGVKLR
jgi:DNA-binding transcriptional LysR family regulator